MTLLGRGVYPTSPQNEKGERLVTTEPTQA
jgi:hypothetical protein